MTANFGSSRFVSLVTALLVMFAGLGLGALPAEAASKGKLQVTVSGPSGVKAKVTVAKKGAKSFSVTKKKSKKSGKRTRTVNTGTWKSKPTFVKKGNAFYVAKASKVKVKKNKTAKMRVKFSKVKVARNPKVASRTDKQIKLKFTAANKKYPVQLRYAQSSKAPKTVKSGKKVSLKKGAKTVTVKGLKANKNHSFSLFTKVSGVWVGPVSLTKVRTKKTPVTPDPEDPEVPETPEDPVFEAAPGITRVSVSSDGVEGSKDTAWGASMSDDGRYVAFASAATELVDQDTKNLSQVYLHDRQDGSTSLVTAFDDGSGFNFNANNPLISGDGRYVFFEIFAKTINADHVVWAPKLQIHRKDLVTGEYELVTKNMSGDPIDGNASLTSVSEDGRWVVFDTPASDLVADDENGELDVFLRDMQAGTIRASVTYTGAEADDYSRDGLVSDDGRYVAFTSVASNLISGESGNGFHAFVRDTHGQGTTKRVDLSPEGERSNNQAWVGSISGDGTLVAFATTGTNMLEEPTSSKWHVFIRNFSEGHNILVDRSVVGEQANSDSGEAVLSRDGKWAAFRSRGTNLFDGFAPLAAKDGVFRSEMGTGEILPVSVAFGGGPADDYSTPIKVSNGGKHILFVSEATNLVAGDSNAKRDLFVWTAP